MKSAKLEKWAELLLDVGKRNNLVNYKDTKSSTLEIICPNANTLFKNAGLSKKLEVFDIKIETSDADYIFNENGQSVLALPAPDIKSLSKEEIICTYSSMIKGTKILIYNSNVIVIKNEGLKRSNRNGRC